MPAISIEALEKVSRDSDVSFSVHNKGEHLIFLWNLGASRIDYWPSTQRAVLNKDFKNPKFLNEKELQAIISKASRSPRGASQVRRAEPEEDKAWMDRYESLWGG